MGSPAVASPWRALIDWRAGVGVWLPLLAITALHYGTPAEHHWVHDVARRLYYLPIVLAAFLAGLRGGLLLALLSSALYLPHAFTHLHHMDPAPALEKFLELVLYVAVGSIGGVLVDRERTERLRQQDLALALQRTLDELKATERQLIRSGRLGALGQLTAGLAHEIKNPLHAMRGTAEIVRDALDEDTAERRMQALHIDEVDRLTGVLERFLDFARPSDPVLARVDLRQVASRVGELIAAQARGDDVQLDVDLPDRAVEVEGDRDQLVQLGLGIALNGLQAIVEGGGERRLAIRLRDETRGPRSFHALAIGNGGPPIPDELRERIFDPFVTTREDGTGLGLPVAARIADAHRGFVETRNLPGGGVEFLVLLPVPDP